MSKRPPQRRVTQIRIGGFGGQGVVLAGTLLGHAAVRDGLWVSGSNAYGAQARGGAARSEVVISSNPISFPHVLRADILAVLSQSAYDVFSQNLAEQGAVVLHDATLVAPRALDGVRQIPVPATETAVSEFGDSQVANIVLLGATVLLTGVVSAEALEQTIREQVDPRFLDLNLRALARGLTILGKKQDEG
ncbi:MAG: 2-oxoacid:acceptor oxidoreductase family protein [Desulfobacteraceae bacterium]